jgi:WD40 repeat protein
MMTVNPHYPTSFHVDPDLQRFNIYETVYDLQTGEVIDSLETEDITVPDGCSRYGLTSVDETLKFTMGHDKRNGQICVLDVQDYQLLQIISVIPDPDYYLYIEGISLSHDGKTLAVASSMGTVDVYRITQ